MIRRWDDSLRERIDHFVIHRFADSPFRPSPVPQVSEIPQSNLHLLIWGPGGSCGFELIHPSKPIILMQTKKVGPLVGFLNCFGFFQQGFQSTFLETS